LSTGVGRRSLQAPGRPSRRTRKDLVLLHRVIPIIHWIRHGHHGIADDSPGLVCRIAWLIGDNSPLSSRGLISRREGRH